ncbi:MAG TPA: GNAT family N-acetyltransferase [Ardenticatenaceae bacterium]|nr:GNAT family N-acetyltransferase [Ardenticatenaceae bacterium]
METHDERNELTIRRATREDVPSIVRLLADDPLGHLRERIEQPTAQAYYDAFDEIDRDPNNALVMVEARGEVIGTLQLTFIRHLAFQGGRRAQIEAVRVDERYRSLGVGRYLFDWAISRAREQGCHLVQLTTNKNRTDAHRFYERLGFVASHEGMKLDLTEKSAS